MPLHRTVSDWGPWKRSQDSQHKEPSHQHFHSTKTVGRPKSFITYSTLDLGEDYKNLYRRRSTYDSEKYRKSPSVAHGYELNGSPPSSSNSVFSDFSSVSRPNQNRHSFAFEQKAVDKYFDEELHDRENPFHNKATREYPQLTAKSDKRYAQTNAWIQNNNHQMQYKDERRLSDRSDQFQRDKSLDETSKVLTEVKLRKREAFLQKVSDKDHSLLKSNDPRNSTRQGRYENGKDSARWSLDLSNIDRERNNLFNVFKNDGIVSNAASRTNSFKEADELEQEEPNGMNRLTDSKLIEESKMSQRHNNETVQEEEKDSSRINSKAQLEKSLTEESDEFIIAEGPNHENIENNPEPKQNYGKESDFGNTYVVVTKDEDPDIEQEDKQEIQSLKSVKQEKQEIKMKKETKSTRKETTKTATKHLNKDYKEGERKRNKRVEKEAIYEVNTILKPNEEKAFICVQGQEMQENDNTLIISLTCEEDQRRPSILPLMLDDSKIDKLLTYQQKHGREADNTQTSTTDQISPIIEQIKVIREFVAESEFVVAASEKSGQEVNKYTTETVQADNTRSEHGNDIIEKETSGIFWADLVKIEECPSFEDELDVKSVEIRRPLGVDQQRHNLRTREDSRRKSWMMNTLADQDMKRRNRHSTSHFVDLL